MYSKTITVGIFLILQLYNTLVQGRCTSTVRHGSRGECVKVVQNAVGTTTDGIFGRNTENVRVCYNNYPQINLIFYFK